MWSILYLWCHRGVILNHFLSPLFYLKERRTLAASGRPSEGPSDGRGVIAPALFSSSRPCRSSPSRSSSWRVRTARSSVLPSTPVLRLASRRRNLGRQHRINTGRGGGFKPELTRTLVNPSPFIWTCPLTVCLRAAASSCDEATPLPDPHGGQ